MLKVPIILIVICTAFNKTRVGTETRYDYQPTMMNQQFRFNVSVVSHHNSHSTDKCSHQVGELTCRLVENCRWCTSGSCYQHGSADNFCPQPFIWLDHIKKGSLPKDTQKALKKNTKKITKAQSHLDELKKYHEYLQLQNARSMTVQPSTCSFENYASCLTRQECGYCHQSNRCIKINSYMAEDYCNVQFLEFRGYIDNKSNLSDLGDMNIN